MRGLRLVLGAAVALPLLGLAAAASAQQVDSDSAVAACVAPADRDRPLSSISESQRLEALACVVRHAAEQINAQTPLRVDDITTLETVTTEGPTVVYHQRISVDASAITPAVKASIDQRVRANVCGLADMRNTIAMGGAYAYIWIDPAGTHVHRLDVRSC